MEDRLLKRNNESFLCYAKRITSNRKEYDIDYSEWAKLLIDKEYSSDNARKAFYIIEPFLNKIEDIQINNISNSDLIKEIEEHKEELEKERIKLQDQKREYRALLRTDARFEHLVSEMKKSIEKINMERPMINSFIENKPDLINHAVLILSDWHFGIEEKNYWNEINVSILKERVNILKDYVVEYCELHKVNTIHIEILGDMINGFLHLGSRVANEEDVIEQTMKCSELICQFLNELALYIPNINVYCSQGNHGRCSANIKESIDTENFEKLIPWYLSGRLKNNIRLIDNTLEHDIIIYKFLNETIFAVHGHNDNIKDVVNNLSNMFKMFPTEVHMGHYHEYNELDKFNITTVVNGTLSGVDKYAKKIRKTCKPEQTLMIYNDMGKLCTYKIKL